jgi:hypothetical protein
MRSFNLIVYLLRKPEAKVKLERLVHSNRTTKAEQLNMFLSILEYVSLRDSDYAINSFHIARDSLLQPLILLYFGGGLKSEVPQVCRFSQGVSTHKQMLYQQDLEP